MLKNGVKKHRKDHRDFSFHKTFGSIGFDVTTLPAEFDVDAGLTMPNQDLPNPTFNINALPFGCTGYTQSELCIDQDGQLYNPEYTYDESLAIAGVNSENQGVSVRDSLTTLIKNGVKNQAGIIGNQRTAYFNIQSSGILDWFDAVRVALWINQQEKRSVSVGTPWFQEWEEPLTGDMLGVLPMPQNVNNISFLSWHNWKISGWKTIAGELYLTVKSWQGTSYGDGGRAYMSRQIINAVMSIFGTCAYTVSKIAYPLIQTVDMGIVETLVSFIRSLLGYT